MKLRRQLQIAAALGVILGSIGSPALGFPQDEEPRVEAQETEEAEEAEETTVTGTEITESALFDYSPTNYIDTAIIRSRVRVRFDAAFESNRPDRAEFFYAKCGCFRNPDLEEALGEAFDPSAPGPGDFPESDVEYRELEFYFERAFKKNRFSLFLEVPLRSVDLGDNDASESGLGDIRIGGKAAIIAQQGRYLSFQLRVYMPSGQASDGLGTDHYTWEPGLLLEQNLSKRTRLTGELRYWYPSSGSSGVGLPGDDDFAGDILRYGLGLAYDFTMRSGWRVTPVVELVGWNVLGGLETAVTSGATPPFEGSEVSDPAEGSILNAKFGLRFWTRGRNSFSISYGTAVTDQVWYDDIVRLEYRVSWF